jgi:hypothetical protein
MDNFDISIPGQSEWKHRKCLYFCEMIRYLLFAIFMLLVLSCENDIDDVNRLFDYPDPKIEVIKQPKIVFSDSAVVQAYVEGPLLHREGSVSSNFTDKFIEGVSVEFVGENGEISSWLFADYGENRSGLNEIYVRDNVLLYNADGDTLQSEDLYWDISKAELYTDKFARLRSKGKLFYGFGFKSKDDFSEWEMKALKGVADVGQ